jgi:peptide/nickel transport system ATP-binding protein
VIFEVCDKIAVMYGGKIVEYADAETIYKSPSHPYTIGLLQSFPSIRGQVRKLVSIPGNPPDLLNPSTGCRFQPRCPIARDICLKDDPPLVSFSRNHFSLCHFASDPKMLRGVRFEE